MQFKSASLYHYPNCKIDAEQLQEQLADRAFVHCKPQQLQSYGWVSPNDSDILAYTTSGVILLKARCEERILPASVIADHMAERIAELEQRFERKIRGKEKLDIRDTVIMELTPQAFTKSSYEQVLIIPDQDLLIVDNTSPKRLDQCTSLLRECVESLPIKPIETDIGPSALFTRWLKGTRCLLYTSPSPRDRG